MPLKLKCFADLKSHYLSENSEAPVSTPENSPSTQDTSSQDTLINTSSLISSARELSEYSQMMASWRSLHPSLSSPRPVQSELPMQLQTASGPQSSGPILSTPQTSKTTS